MSISTASCSDRTASEAMDFVCSEVWGGNRSVQTEVRLPGMIGWIYSRPCGGNRGGDVHYLSTCSAGLMTRVCLADVVGHGEQVAQISDWMHGLLRKYMSVPDPSRVLQGLNRKATDAGIGAMTTAVLLSYYAPIGQLRYTYAGHPHVMHYRASDGQWARLGLPSAPADQDGCNSTVPPNMPLGIDANVCFKVGTAELEPGDRLVIYSDGITETPTGGGEMFGSVGLSRHLEEHRAAPADTLGPGLIENLHSFSGKSTLDHDDVTLIVLDTGQRVTGYKMLHMIRNQAKRAWQRLTA